MKKIFRNLFAALIFWYFSIKRKVHIKVLFADLNPLRTGQAGILSSHRSRSIGKKEELIPLVACTWLVEM
ncbi:MAG: hypothetical protein IH620_00195 [Ignavibacterium sp.]|nr:hypothetical protein [Ignavibacterium sp.]